MDESLIVLCFTLVRLLAIFFVIRDLCLLCLSIVYAIVNTGENGGKKWITRGNIESDNDKARQSD